MPKPIIAFCLGVCLTMSAVALWPRMRSVPVQAQSQIDLPTRGRACANGILQGGYTFELSGDIVTGNNAGPYGAVGVLTFDGTGGATLVSTQNYNGALINAFNVSGRYGLGTDCAGQLILATNARFELVTDNRGSEVRFLQLNGGSVIRGIAKKQ